MLNDLSIFIIKEILVKLKIYEVCHKLKIVNDNDNDKNL
jgi:hypothetical protein